MSNQEPIPPQIEPTRKESSNKELTAKAELLESIVKDILPKENNSFGDEEIISDKSIDFNEFSDEIFNAPVDSIDTMEQASIAFNRNKNENKAQTMKTYNTLLTKNDNIFNVDINNNYNNNQGFNVNKVINNGYRGNKKNFKTTSSQNNTALLNNIYNTMYGGSFNPRQYSCFYNNNSTINTTLSSSQNNNISFLSNNNNFFNDSLHFENNHPSHVRNYYVKKTYNNQIYNNNFNIDILNKPSNHSSKKLNTFIPQNTKRFHTTIPYRKVTSLPWEIELFLNELEIALSRSGYIDLSIYSTIKPRVLLLIKTQMGSRILQNYLPKTPMQILNMLYEDIYEQLNVLLLDPYANYFCLKLFCFIGANERISYLRSILSNIVTFSVNKIATYPIQCIIGNLSTKKEKELLMEHINGNIKKLTLDIYGTHVIEKIIMCLETEYCTAIIQFILDNYVYLANHVNGLCLAKKILMIEYKKENYKRLKQILIEHCLDLIENPYGNYALQIVIDYWEQDDVLEIISKLLGHCTELSMMKYSSNVIERCIQKSEIFLNKFIQETCFEYNSVGTLIKNNYGNYVIQTALKTAKSRMKISLINAIENNLNILGEKKLINKWKSILASNIIECVNNGNNISNIKNGE